MLENQFIQQLKSGKLLISDGATGTNMYARGLPAGTAPDEWVFENPEQVIQLHRDFINAGSNIILTNTFGSTSLRLRGSKYGGKAIELNQRAVELAIKAVSAGEVFIGGSLGPVGALLKPYGPLEEDQVREAYAEQAMALSNGVDILVIETQFSLEEAHAALKGVQSVSQLPVVISFSFDSGMRTMMGVKPQQVVENFKSLGLAAIGANCGKSLELMEKIIREMNASNPGLPIWAKPNAGIPVPGSDPARYDTTPEQMAEAAVGILAAGAKIIGGCCGSTPAHISAIAATIKR